MRFYIVLPSAEMKYEAYLVCFEKNLINDRVLGQFEHISILNQILRKKQTPSARLGVQIPHGECMYVCLVQSRWAVNDSY